MTDRPIIFSAPMVRALLAGRKTMIRRLVPSEASPGTTPYGSSIWMRAQPGDRLWVRETWQQEDKGIVYRATWRPKEDATVSWRSPIHMSRRASRLTLIVTATKIQRLNEISETDAIAEGAYIRADRYWTLDDEHAAADPGGPAYAFRMLWSVLHGNHSWDANPEVAALTFIVHQANIDALTKTGPANVTEGSVHQGAALSHDPMGASVDKGLI